MNPPVPSWSTRAGWHARGVSDPIPPPSAHDPAEALHLVSVAVSDGDLGAAVAQYEPGAVLCPWAGQPAAAPPSQPAAPPLGVAGQLIPVLDLRLPLVFQAGAVLLADGLALVLGERRMAGAVMRTGRIQLHGAGATALRRQPDGTWLIVTDAWCLAGPGQAGWPDRGGRGIQRGTVRR